MKPANTNTPGPCVPPAVHEMREGLADLRKILGMPEPEEPMRVESYETVAREPRVGRPARNYRDCIGGDDE